MAHKKTLAIIGACSSLGSFIAKGISSGPYRLLLMDNRPERLTLIKNHITTRNKNAEAEMLQCCKDASWEADIIILAVGESLETAKKIEEVSTRKIVINVIQAPDSPEALQIALPFSKVVNVLIPDSDAQHLKSTETLNAYIEGYDDEAVKLTAEIIKTIGLNAVAHLLKPIGKINSF